MPEDRSSPAEIAIELRPCTEPSESKEADGLEPSPLDLEQPVCVTAWYALPACDAPNMTVRRGCATTPGAFAFDWMWCERNARRRPQVPGAWFGSEEPGGARTWAKNGEREGDAPVDLDTGTIRGHVVDFAPEDLGHLWVVAFHDGPANTETLVEHDGSFAFVDLPTGRWGLRVGDDSCEALWEQRATLHLDDHEQDADPWPGAVIVEVESGREHDGVTLRHRAE